MSFNRSTSQNDGDIVDKIKSVNWRGLVRQATNKVKQYAMNLSPLEVQVEEATNMDTWGPHGSVMSDISDACYDPEGYKQVLGVIARRLQEKDERWRMCYKALLLLEYLIKHGPTKVAQDVASSSSVLNKLQSFEYLDANGKDHGVNIRHRATEICDLVNNPARLKEERAKAAENKAKYTGVSASQMRSGAVGFGSTSVSSGGSHVSSFSMPAREPSSPPGTFSGSSLRPTAVAKLDSFEQEKPPDSFKVNSVQATQARIASLKISERSKTYADPDDKKPMKKKLSDVKANPKIAASLGLKIASPSKASPSKPATAPAPNKPAADATPSPLDLLAELDNPVVDAEPQDVKSSHIIVDNTTTTNGKDPFLSLVGETTKRPETTSDPFATLMTGTEPVASQPKQPEPEKKDPFADLLL
jgi:epsin